MTRVALVKDILEVNERLALENAKLFEQHNIHVINLMGSPGAGKTALLEQTAKQLPKDIRWAVIEGDIHGSFDAERLERLGVPVVQINTQGACHLDANVIREALTHVDLESLDLLVIENVGNLVCPAEFNIGEHQKVMVLSTTEGEDKPEKYPLMFREARLMLLNKIDLLPYLSFDEKRFEQALENVHSELPVLRVSCSSGEGIGAWINWLQECVKKQRAA